MDRVQLTLTVLLHLFSNGLTFGVPGDAMVFFPPEARAMNQFHYAHPQFRPMSRNTMPQGYYMERERAAPQEHMEPQGPLQPILHSRAVNLPVSPPVPKQPLEVLNYTTNDVDPNEDDPLRAAKAGYEYPSHPPASYPQASSYGYSQPAPSYGPTAPAPAAAPSYSTPAPAHAAPTSKFSLFKPDLTDLIKPVTTKVATKVSGLIGLVLSLLTGSAPDDLEMKGFKDIVINGIVKPLLIAKGGIKSLISKLTIPVISLLLINLEVLITVWWLWEECPQPTVTDLKPTYTPNYNSYR